jgi:hypothetical protein
VDDPYSQDLRSYVLNFLSQLPSVFKLISLLSNTGSVLSKIGVNGGAIGQPHISTPYHGHAPVQVSFLLENVISVNPND